MRWLGRDAAEKDDHGHTLYEAIWPDLHLISCWAHGNAALAIPPGESAVLALDWMNGRRTPDANQALKGAISGLNLASDAPAIFRAITESTCFGAKAIVDRFISEGIPIRGLIGLGGVAK